MKFHRILLIILVIFTIAILVLAGGCSYKYEVVQYLYENKYHTQNVRNNDVRIFISDRKLYPGDIIIIKNKPKNDEQ